MFRAAMTLLGILLFGVLAAVAWNGWETQQSMTAQMNQLQEELAALNQTQRELLQQQTSPKPLEITGRAYYGDKTTPASGASIQVCRFTDQPNELGAIRTVTADAQGEFGSGPLQPGDYYLLAGLVDPADSESAKLGYYVQSQPYFLYPGSPQPEPTALDLKLETGELAFTVKNPMPTLVQEQADEKGGGSITLSQVVALGIRTEALGFVQLPWRPTFPEPAEWPLRGMRRSPSQVRYEGVDYTISPLVLAVGRYRIRVRLERKPFDRNQSP